MKSLGRRVDIVNLDFANDTLSYTPSIDVRELITLEVSTYELFVFFIRVNSVLWKSTRLGQMVD